MHNPGQEVRASTAMWINATSPGPPPQLSVCPPAEEKETLQTRNFLLLADSLVPHFLCGIQDNPKPVI
jgi:hypothetical protein